MMLNLKNSLLLLAAVSVSMCIKAQDSIRIFPKINNQYSIERNFRSQFYYNPANKSDYSASSFSEFSIGYHDDDHRNVYREQLGAGDKGLSVSAASFLKLNTNRSVWGEASYQNLKKRPFRWNENLDYERIAPYTTADSLGGTLNVERYFFAGGLSQKIKRWTVGGEVSYLAQLGYRSRDPRLKSTTSDLSVNAGVNYKVFREYEVGIFGTLNKYTQSSSLTFQSSLGKPFVYQMTGLGNSNYFFSGGVNPSQTFEEFGYKGGIQLTGEQGKDFYLRASAGRSNNTKNHKDKGSNTSFEISELENKNFELEAAKFLTLKENHRIGLSANYKAMVRTGSEFGYSVNTNATEQIFKRQSYRSENFMSSVKAFYQYNQDDFTVSASPFFGYEEIKEQNLYPNSGQKFEYSYLGITADYRQSLNPTQMISFQPYFSKRTVNKSINALSMTTSKEINEWILNDYQFQASDITTFGASLRYDIKLEKLPAFYICAEYQTQKIQKKNNNFAGASLGITF